MLETNIACHTSVLETSCLLLHHWLVYKCKYIINTEFGYLVIVEEWLHCKFWVSHTDILCILQITLWTAFISVGIIISVIIIRKTPITWVTLNYTGRPTIYSCSPRLPVVFLEWMPLICVIWKFWCESIASHILLKIFYAEVQMIIKQQKV